MTLSRVLIVLVPLLQLIVLDADAFVGNSRSWNSRDLSLPRRSAQNPAIYPVHSVPRPQPKPIERKPITIPVKSNTVPEETNVVYVEGQPEVSNPPITRSNYQTRRRPFNLQRRPIATATRRPEPTPVAPIHVAPAPVALAPVAPAPVAPAPVVPEPVSIAPVTAAPEVPATPVPVEIAPERVEIISNYASTISLPAEPTPAPEIPKEESNDSEDIEVHVSRSLPSSTRRPILRNRMNLAKPVPRPVNNRIVVTQPPPPIQPEPEISSPAPVRSVTIMEYGPEPESVAVVDGVPSRQPVEFTPTSGVDRTSSTTLVVSKPTEPAIIAESSTPRVEFIPKTIMPGSEELIYDMDEESDISQNDLPVASTTAQVVTEPEPATIVVKEYKPEITQRPAQASLNNWRRRRPINRKPETVTRPLPVPTPTLPRVTPRPMPLTIPPQPVSAKPTEPKPAREPVVSPTPSPSMGRTVIPTRTIATVKPAPIVTPTVPVNNGRSVISRATTAAPIPMLGFACEDGDGYYSISNDCDSYVECQSYSAMMNSCPDGLHFNPRALWPEYPCAYPSEVQCESNSRSQNAQPTEECPRQYGFFPMSDSDCSRYVMCQEGYATIMNCPPGLVFNAGTSTCDWPENVPSCSPDVFRGFKCPEPPLEEDGLDMIYKYRYGDSCKEYVACQRGHPRLLSCDPGLSFDDNAEVCIDSEYVLNCKS